MTRALQNRLALANVKVQKGWQNLSLDTIEPQVDGQLKRKRPASSSGALSDTSSVSDRFIPLSTIDSSPLGAPIFSDDVYPLGRSGGPKRTRSTANFKYPGSSNHTRTKVRTSSMNTRSWKTQYRLPESSPVYHRQQSYIPQHSHNLSFISEGSTVPDDILSPHVSEDDDEDLPLHSFHMPSSNIRSSPPPRTPRTPTARLSRSARLRGDPFNPRQSANGEEDASLLINFATSPSPAQRGRFKSRVEPPSTPPPKSTPLPSSMMSTPGGTGAPFQGFGINTPGTNLNFADFLNMTPSPAQTSNFWTRTPATGKTPIAAREARKRLNMNFDSLLPPSPIFSKPTKIDSTSGLGMDLGGELVS
jgi:hypothetical protein